MRVAGAVERGGDAVLEDGSQRGDPDRDAAQPAGVVEPGCHAGAGRVDDRDRGRADGSVGEADPHAGQDKAGQERLP
jgi:hypothetical protein